MEYASATVVSKSQNIELDYLAYDAFSIETQLIDVKKGYFVHITQDNEFIADGIVSDVRPDKKTQQISIRPIQALFDAEVFYEPISSSIQWLADTITSYFISNTDTSQNRPIDLTYTLTPNESLSLIENFQDVGDTVNLLSVIETALKTYSVVVDMYLDMATLRIKVNIHQQTETKTLEADLENVLESDVTLGDSYGSINKAVIRKYDYVETTSGGQTTKERRILGDFIFYRLSDDSIVKSTDTYDTSLRIFPVFWDLVLIEKKSDQTNAKWLEEATDQAKEVLTPETYDQEIVLKYHNDDKLVRPMDIKIGTIITVYLKGETYTSILAAKRIEGNTVTLTLGAVRTELTKKLSMDRIGGGTSGGGGGGSGGGGTPGPQGVGISSVEQTTTSTEDHGINVVTVTKTDGTSSTFEVRNGSKGSTGTAAGFGTPTASASTLAAGATATANISTSGSNTSKVFNFTFGIPKGDKGDKGDTGSAAGFANPTASAITLSAGTSATASVSSSGSNTMKQFDFTFGIPQGAKGDKGDTGTAAGFGTPTASATTLSAGSSATASVTASGGNTSKVFAFNFGIPKGDKGDQGNPGAAAGFGTPTASVSTLSAGSSATVSVAASGADTSKVFNFQFGIPKGDKGDTGTAAGFGTPTASATTLSAGSSATASVTASGGNTSKVFNFSFGIPKGDTGATGASIQSITRTSGSGQPGETDTYTITLTNGNTSTFQVKNGNDGTGAVIRQATLTSNGWSNNSQTVTVSATTSDATDYLAIPDLSTASEYSGAGVTLSSVTRGEGTVALTFTCTSVPSSTVYADVIITTANDDISDYLNGVVNDMTTLYNQTEADFNTASGLYVKKAGDTMTGVLTMKGNMYNDARDGALNMNNSDIYGANSIYTADKSDGAAEGIHFYRDGTHVDSLWIADGAINFVPNRVLGTNTTAANSQKVARFTSTPTTGKAVVTDGTTGGLIVTDAVPAATKATQNASGENIDDTYIRYNDRLFTTDPFAPSKLKSLYISKIDNSFYAADKRYNISGTNGSNALTAGEIASLFDGNYDSQTIKIQNGNTLTLTIDFSNLSDSKYPGYPYGDLILSFYYVTKPASITGRVYNNYSSQGVGWKDLTFTAIANENASQIWKAYNSYYGLQTIEITIVGDTTNSYGYTSPVQLEFRLDRPAPNRTPVVSKYIPETLYYDLTAPHFIGALTGNASTATKLATGRTIQTNLGLTTSATFDGSANVTPGITGTLGVANGGTGQTSAINASNALLNALTTGSSTPTDADYYISQYVGGGTTTTTYHRRPMSALWEYVKGKISSVLGLTASSYSGAAASANSVDPANITDGYTSKGFYLNTHPENGKLLIPFMNNDIAYLTKRGGSAAVYYDDVLQSSVDISNVFDGSPSYWTINNTNINKITIELTLHKTFTYSNVFYIDFGASNWRAKSIKVEVINTNYTSDVWTEKGSITNNSLGAYKLGISHQPVGASNTGGGFNKLRVTLDDYASHGTSNSRIACIGLLNFGSAGLRETFVPRNGGEVFGGITPYANNSYALGSSSKKWSTIYATSFDGTATKATADASGNNIKTTYLNGGSITVTPSTTTVNSITDVGALPTLTFTPNSSTKNMAIAWSQGTLPTKGSNTTVATGISSATFTGTHPS